MAAKTERSPVGPVLGLVLPVALAVVWFTTALLQRVISPTLATELAVIALAPVLLVWALMRHRPTRHEALIIVPAAIPVLLMLLAAWRSGEPRAALLGSPPLWQGSLMWVGALAWFVAIVLGSRRSDLMNVAKLLAAAGTMTALWAFGEHAGLIPHYDPTQPGSTALLGHHLSLGTALLITATCTLALSLRRNAERPWLPSLMKASALLQVAAIAAVGARGSLLALLFGVAAYAVTRPGSERRDRVERVAGVAILSTFLLGFALTTAAWSGALGAKAFAFADRMLNGRATIWQEVAERLAPDSGFGAGRFDALLHWTVTADKHVEYAMTYDPHSILLTWLIASGIVGVIAFASAALLLGTRVAHVLRVSGSTRPLRVLAAGLAAVFMAMLATWPDPLTLISVTCVAACVVAPNAVRAEVELARGRTPWIAVVAPVAIAVSAAVIATNSLAIDIRTEYVLNSAEPGSAQLVAQLAEAAAATHDPYYIENELWVDSQAADPSVRNVRTLALVRALAEDYPQAAAGQIDLPLLALEIVWEHRNELSPEELWQLSAFFSQRGLEADRDLGVWKYALARAAHATHSADESAYLRAAEAEDLPPSADRALGLIATSREVTAPPAVLTPEP